MNRLAPKKTEGIRKAPARRRRRRQILLAGVCLLGGGAVALHVVFGHGRWRELAANTYHSYQSARLQRAYAREISLERAEQTLPLFQGRLSAGWADWSWADHDLRAEAPASLGGTAIGMTPGGFKGLYLHHDPIGTEGYGLLRFFVRGTPRLNACTVDAGGKFGPQVPVQKYCVSAGAPAGWSVARIPLADLNVPRYDGRISGVVLQASQAAAQTPTALAEIALLPDPDLPPTPTRATVGVTVDARAGSHPISPLIYGMAFAPAASVRDLRLTLNRWGGNDKSRYNWVLGNADNAARDWRFADRTAYENAPNGTPSSAADEFVHRNGTVQAATLLTVPTLGWVARDADNGSASQDVPDTGGAPLRDADGPIAGYDPSDNRHRTSTRSRARAGRPFRDRPTLVGGVVYQDEWIHHLVRTFGPARAGGVRFYAMDNEPDLWDSTHTDVHPARMGYDDLLGNFLDYAAAVKDVDPTAQVTGPVSSGWTGYYYSPLDRGADNFHTHADRTRHGGTPFLPWFLQRVREHDVRTGRRTLDVLDVHYYPQGTGLYGPAADPDARARRLRATRSLWDASYTDESWIGQPVRLLPQLREWIAQNYPGTRLGITEWSFGADGDISGALAIADVLGIYGREGVYLANYWAFPAPGSPGYLAFKLYRNADGMGHGFGDTACRAVSTAPGRVSIYAASDSRDGALTVMLINKMPEATVSVPVTLMGSSGPVWVKMWRLGADNPNQIVPAPVMAFSGRKLTETLPPYSATLLRISAKGGKFQ